MVRTVLPMAGIGAAALVAGYVGTFFLPVTMLGLPTPVLLLGCAGGAITWAVRYL